MPETPSSVQTWQNTSRRAIFAVVFLVPLFFLPFTSNVLDFNKQALLATLILLSLFAWLLKSLIAEKIDLNLNWFNLAPLSVMVFVGLSTLFSAYPYASFWGWPLNVSASFLTTLALVLFYFLVTHLFREPEEVFGLILVLVVSGLLVSLLAVPQIVGQFPLPFDFTQNTSFNTVGNPNSLAVFLAVLLPLATSLIFISKSRLVRTLLWLFVLTAVFLLLAINFSSAWIVLLAGTSLILILGITRREIFNLSWLFLPMVLLALALFARVTNTQLLPAINLPAEVSPSQSSSWQIAGQTLTARPPFSWFWGSGPGTFIYDYSRFKPSSINQSAFWATRFGSAGSQILDWLATIGPLGLLAFLATLGSALWLGFRAVSLRTAGQESFVWILLVGLWAGLVGLAFGFWLYPANLTLLFLFWFVAAAIIGLTAPRARHFDLRSAETTEIKKVKSSGPWATVGVSFAFIAVLIGAMGVFFVLGQRYFAEASYVQALTAVQKGDNQKALEKMALAIRFTNGQQDNYWRDVTQVYLFRIQEELAKKNLSNDQKSQNVSNLISQLVAAAKASTDASGQNVANWTIRGFVYNQILNLIPDADKWAVSAYEEAIKLEPSNPSIYASLGQIYLARADNLANDKDKQAERQQALEAARDNFQKARDLKNDYAPALFQLAMIDVREQKVKDAIAKLEDTKVIAPFDTGLAFQLGLIYQADNQRDKAQAEFERAVALDSNYANARYFLGLLSDAAGQKDKAIEQFQKIADLNPGNDTIKKILEGLKAGRKAADVLTELQPPQPPVQEKPAEQLASPSPSPSPSALPSPKPAPKKR